MYHLNHRYTNRHPNKKNNNKSMFWVCSTCQNKYLTTNKNKETNKNEILMRSVPNFENHSCQKMTNAEIDSHIQYTKLKSLARENINERFNFSKTFSFLQNQLLQIYKIEELDKYFQNIKTAKSTCNSIRQSLKKLHKKI